MSHKKIEPPKRYRITSIAIDTEGTFWVHYVGDVPEQGGCFFGEGSVGFKDLDDALEFTKHTMNKHHDAYMEQIKKRAKELP